MSEKQKIFLVEDDYNFGAVLKSYLEMNNYYVLWVDDGKYAFNKFKSDKFDICVLDIMLPNKDGYTIASEIKMLYPNIPLIFLTAKTLKEDILQGFKLGADDYITKPFDSEILLHKIKAILKRNGSAGNQSGKLDKFSIGKYLFNYKLRTIVFGDSVQKLSPKEAELLKLLCVNRDNVLSKEIALKTIWGDDSYFTSRSMDVFIAKLRKYLGDDPSVKIITIRGSGFCLVIEKESDS
ncbi:response regulator transcription factor [Bacteroidota bacterium]